MGVINTVTGQKKKNNFSSQFCLFADKTLIFLQIVGHLFRTPFAVNADAFEGKRFVQDREISRLPEVVYFSSSALALRKKDY